MEEEEESAADFLPAAAVAEVASPEPAAAAEEEADLRDPAESTPQIPTNKTSAHKLADNEIFQTVISSIRRREVSSGE